jgi:hypothetical protein
LAVLVLAGLASALAGCASSDKASNLPTETADGLRLQQSSNAGALYLRPGVDFSIYEDVGLVPCQVSFRENWMRDQNRDRLALDNRVTQRDMDRILDELSKECDAYFRAALLEDPPYNLVDTFHEGQRVLLIAPAIVNLDVTAPDLRTTGRTRTYTTSTGEMTLLLNIIDGTTRQSLAQVADRQQDPDFGASMQWSNSVTNRSDAERILKSWSSRLRTGLDRVVSRAKDAPQ